MVSRITAALAARYKAIQEKEKGFTLIELLVVVIIIGVLAAIAIPIYIGVQDNAKNSAVQSDLTNTKIAVVAAYTADPSATMITALTPATPVGGTTLGALGATASAAYGTGSAVAPAFVGTATWTDFCIEATGENGSEFHITDSEGVETGGCI